MSKKFSGAFDKWCAGGAPPMNDGRYAYQGVRGDTICPSCHRETHLEQACCMLCYRVIRRRKDGTVMAHIWQPKDPNVKPGDSSTNSQANLAARAFERTRRTR